MDVNFQSIRHEWPLRISLILLASVPVLPLFAMQRANPLPSFHIEWLAITAGLLAWLGVLPVLLRTKLLRIPRTVFLPVVLMACIAAQIQLLPQVNSQHAHMAMLYLLWAALLMVLVGQLTEQTSSVRIGTWLASGLSAAAVFAACGEVVMRLNGIQGWWGGLAQANNYGDLVALGLVSVLYLFTVASAERRIYLLMLLAVIVVGLSLTSSRSVWLYWLAMSLLAWRWQRSLLKVLVPAFGGYLLLQALWATGLLPTQQTAVERLYQEVGGSSQRLHIWIVAWNLFLQAPWLGQGFGQFDWGYFNAGQHITELGQRVEHAHNLILHLLAEMGVFPVLLLLGFVGLWLRRIVSSLEAAAVEQKEGIKRFQLWLLMLTAILGIHSLLEYPLWYAEFLGIAAMVLALGDDGRLQIRLGKVGVGAITGLLVIGIAIAGAHEWHYAKMERALNDLSRDPTQSKFSQLLGTCQQASVQAPLLTPYVAMVFSFAASPADEKLRPDLTLFTDAGFRFFPSKELAYQQAELQALNGLREESRQTMNLALAAYPNETKRFLNELKWLNETEKQKVEHLRKMAELEQSR